MPETLAEIIAHHTETTLESYALALAEAFDQAERSGLETDEPEGARFVLLSDTLTRLIASDLRKLAAQGKHA